MAVVCSYMSNSHSKCKWIEFTNPKAHSGWMDLKKKQLYVIYRTLFIFEDTEWLKGKDGL